MKLEVTVRGQRRILDVAGDVTSRIAGAGEDVVVALEPVAGTECWRLRAGDEVVPVRIRADGGTLRVTMGASQTEVRVRRALPIPSRRAGAAAGLERVEVRAPMPGLVVALPRETGERVARGEAVVVVEAMKMQMEVPAPASGRIAEVRVRPGQEVMGGQILAVVAMESAGTEPGPDPEGSR